MRKEIPVVTNGSPLGTTWELRTERLSFLGRLGREGHDIARARFFDRYLTFINSPALLQEVIVERARSFEKSLGIRIAFYPIAGEGLTTSEGELWRRQRRLMAPLFQHSQIAHYVDDMVDCAVDAASAWTEGQRIELHRETTRIAMAVAGRTLFDAESLSAADEIGSALTSSLHWINGRLNSPMLMVQLGLIDALKWAMPRLPARLRPAAERLIDRLRAPLYLPGRRHVDVMASIRMLDRRVQQMIEERRAAGLVRPDLLTKLLKARDEDDGTRMSDKQVRDEILTLFIGGHEGTSNSLAFTLYFLMTHPQVYERVQAEVDALEGRRPTAADLPRLPYTLRALKESMRVYPPAYLFGKVAVEDIEAGGYLIPRGSDVFISPYALHRRSDLWPDPERFDPDRFTPEAEEGRHRFAYLPFSLGPRICIGNHFALMEGQVVLAALLQRARFTLEPGQEIRPAASATLRPNALYARVSLRSGVAASTYATENNAITR